MTHSPSDRTAVAAGIVAPTQPTQHREMFRGATAMLPLTLGYLPFGMLLGAAVAASTEPAAAWSGSLLIYGGSAHLTLLELLRNGSSVFAVVGAALLINTRLLVYSSALVPLWGSSRMRWKVLAAATVIDPTWMLAERRAAEPGDVADRRAHYTGAALCLTAGWLLAITAGVLLGSVVESTAALSVVVPLCLTAIIAPHLRVGGGPAAIAAGIVTALATSGWPAGYGIPAAMAAAAAAGGLTMRRSS